MSVKNTLSLLLLLLMMQKASKLNSKKIQLYLQEIKQII